MNLSQAQAALHAGRPYEAEQICRAIIDRVPQCWPAWLVLTDCVLAQGNLAAADALTADQLGRAPSQPDVLVARGITLARLSRVEEATDLVDQAIDIRLDFPRAHEELVSLLEQRRDPRPRYEVSVITPSIGTQFLQQAIDSVQLQRYPFVRHFIVADGPECYERIAGLMPAEPRHPIHVMQLPMNVGGGGFNGHRVYGAMPFLVPSRFVAFLDEDNWFSESHLETLMQYVTARGLAWAHSLRTIVSLEGEVITTDDCESLGKWPTWNNPEAHLVDVNCYVLRRDLAVGVSPLWYRRFRDQESPDFVLCKQLLAEQPRYATTGRYTVYYRVGRSPCSVTSEFFLHGNRVMQERCQGSLPWRESEIIPVPGSRLLHIP